MKAIFILVTIITFVIFYIEAMIHFSEGKHSRLCEDENNLHNYIEIFGIKLHLPDHNEAIIIGRTVLIFSIINGFISSYLIKHHIKSLI